MTIKRKTLRLVKDKSLRNKFLADQIKIGLRYQLRSLREAQGLTQKDLADLIGTKQSVISRLEKKPERVSIPTLLDIAEALDVGVVVRFEAIDTVLEWYTNPAQKKMTPQKSEDILNKMETKSDILNEEILFETEFFESTDTTGRFSDNVATTHINVTPVKSISPIELDSETKKRLIRNLILHSSASLIEQIQMLERFENDSTDETERTSNYSSIQDFTMATPN